MQYNSELIKEKTNVINKLIYQLKKDIISDKNTSKMLKDLRDTISKLIISDF